MAYHDWRDNYAWRPYRDVSRDTHPPGSEVWICAYGWWRRAVIVRWLRKRVAVEYALKDGSTKTTKAYPEADLFDREIDPTMFRDTDDAPRDLSVPAWFDRPIAEASMWEAR